MAKEINPPIADIAKDIIFVQLGIPGMQLLYVISINLSYNHSELALLSIGEHCNTLFVMLLLVGQFVYFV